MLFITTYTYIYSFIYYHIITYYVIIYILLLLYYYIYLEILWPTAPNSSKSLRTTWLVSPTPRPQSLVQFSVLVPLLIAVTKVSYGLLQVTFEGRVHTDMDGMEGEAAMLHGGCCQPCRVPSEEAADDGCWHSTHLLLFSLQAMGWCKPFSTQLPLSGDTFTDTLKSGFPR